MNKLSIKKEIKIFFSYFFSYVLLFLPVLVFIFDGRALVAEARYYASNPQEIAFLPDASFFRKKENNQIVSLPGANSQASHVPQNENLFYELQTFSTKASVSASENAEKGVTSVQSPAYFAEKPSLFYAPVQRAPEARQTQVSDPAAMQVSSPKPVLSPSPIVNTFSTDETGIVIPKIRASAPIVFSQSLKNRDILKDLEKGVALYPESVKFGEQGVSILLGHSSAYPWYRGKYGSVFSLLNKLKPGDEFIVFYQGKQYTYRVAETKIVIPADFSLENAGSGSYLVLVSCWPVGTNRKRIVVFSDLVSVLEQGGTQHAYVQNPN